MDRDEIGATTASQPTVYAPAGESPLSGAGETATLQLREEELVAEKRLVQSGIVRIRRRVIEETRTIDVVVRREDMVVERLPVQHSPGHIAAETAGAEAGPALAELLRALQLGETLRLPIVEDEIVVQTRPIVTHELVIDKRLVEEVLKLSDTVRREDALITHNAGPQPEPASETGGPHELARTTRPALGRSSVPEDQLELAHPNAADASLELRQEELRVRTRVVDAGTVQVRTGTLSELRSVVVRAEHEETAVELVPVEPRPSERPVGSGDDIFDIPEYGEAVSLRKTPVVTEEITLAKETRTDVEQVTVSLGREIAHVELQGDVRLAAADPSREDHG
ncbi:MAG: DUF2382 domain-containing protein [Chloroflexota bacterium]